MNIRWEGTDCLKGQYERKEKWWVTSTVTSTGMVQMIWIKREWLYSWLEYDNIVVKGFCHFKQIGKEIHLLYPLILVVIEVWLLFRIVFEGEMSNIFVRW